MLLPAGREGPDHTDRPASAPVSGGDRSGSDRRSRTSGRRPGTGR